jgi:hypothetical protein
MTFELKIDENDYLIYQLFVASKSESVKKKRSRNKIIVPIVYIVLAVYGFYQNNLLMGVSFCDFAILWFFIYPLWDRNNYVRHYKNFIKENHKDSFGKSAFLEISNEHVFVKDEFSEAKISTSEIEEIYEIPTTIFIRMKAGKTFILPKDKIAEIKNLKSVLTELSNFLKINYISDENWKWK